ncbi:unnamed protein product [Effrenium voratum]|nr:unnamed protein product [Effrenium voratum]
MLLVSERTIAFTKCWEACPRRGCPSCISSALSSTRSSQATSRSDADEEKKWHAQFEARDVKLFQRLCDALSIVGFSDEDIDAIFQVLAGLVHLGDLSNCEKDEGDETATVQLDEGPLEKAAELLGMDASELGSALKRRKVRVQSAGRESLHEVPRSTSQFRTALHSLIKALYKRLFERLVQRINSSFGEWRATPDEDDTWRQIGILDIYGFERLKRNSFEQLCINLANERLQQYFVDSLRKEVLRPLKMSNKRGSKAGTGLALNEGFVVKHYAGPVEYNTKGWLDKNNDRLLVECEELICDSSFDFVKSLRDEDKTKVPFRSISKKYCADLESLLQTLNTCHLHYIRCFKPNEEQKPSLFKDKLVLDQIIQCGTIELVKIMHDGYPNRCPFNEIVTRFRDLLPESFQRYGDRTFIEALMLAYDVHPQEWALGMSRLFLKAGQLKALEDMRAEGVQPDPEKLRQIVRQIIRKRWVRAKNAGQLFLAELRRAKAARILATRALLVGRVQPMLLAAREKLRLRALAARRRLCGGFCAVRLSLVLMKEARARRRERLAKSLHLFYFMQKRLRPLADGARQRTAEESKKKEAERRREEERRIAEERRKIEEERRRMEEEVRQKAEEERRLALAKLEEEQRLREEHAEAKRLDEIRKVREEMERMQRDKEEQEREIAELRRRKDEERILDVASPCRSSPVSRRVRKSGSQREAEDDASTSVGDTDESVTISMSQFQKMEERIKALEQEMARKQTQTQEEMMALFHRTQGMVPLGSPEERQELLQLPSTPPRSRPRISSARISTDSRPTGDDRRTSIIDNDKANWTQQRDFLMSDLYPEGCHPRFRSTRTRRSSIGGGAGEKMQAERKRRATQTLATTPERGAY